MYLLSRIRELYETSNPNTTEYILSQYILKNIKHFDDLSISNMAKETAISKSAISKFFKSISCKNGFHQFKSSMQHEIHYTKLNEQSLISHAKEVGEMCLKLKDGKIYKVSDYINLNEIKMLSFALKKAEKIIFCGNDTKKGFFSQLIDYLLYDGKDVKYASWIYSQDKMDDLTNLDEKCLMILVDPRITLYDFYQRFPISVEIILEPSEIKAQKIFIGRPSKPNTDFATVGIQSVGNLFYDDMIFVYFVAVLTYQYLAQ